MQPLAGKIYTFFPLKSTYLVFLGIFELGNLVCALAPSSAAFIAGRAVAGLGAAALFNGGMVMFTAAAAPDIRPTVIGIGMAITAIGGVVGPVMGGAITDHLGWRWCKFGLQSRGPRPADRATLLIVNRFMDLSPGRCGSLRAFLPHLHT